MKIKTVFETGSSYLAHPLAPLGFSNNDTVFTVDVVDIPEGVSAAQALKAFNSTIISAMHAELSYTSLGAGKIVK